MIKGIIAISKSDSFNEGANQYYKYLMEIINNLPSAEKYLCSSDSNSLLTCLGFEVKNTHLRDLVNTITKNYNPDLPSNDIYVKVILLDIQCGVIENASILTLSRKKNIISAGIGSQLRSKLEQAIVNRQDSDLKILFSWLGIHMLPDGGAKFLKDVGDYLASDVKPEVTERSLIESALEEMKKQEYIVSRRDLIKWHKQGIIAYVAKTEKFYLLKKVYFSDKSSVEVYVE